MVTDGDGWLMNKEVKPKPKPEDGGDTYVSSLRGLLSRSLEDATLV